MSSFLKQFQQKTSVQSNEGAFGIVKNTIKPVDKTRKGYSYNRRRRQAKKKLIYNSKCKFISISELKLVFIRKSCFIEPQKTR